MEESSDVQWMYVKTHFRLRNKKGDTPRPNGPLIEIVIAKKKKMKGPRGSSFKRMFSQVATLYIVFFSAFSKGLLDRGVDV